MLGRVVDALPLRLWKVGNLYLGHRLHFCVGDRPGDSTDAGVRTVEWNGRVVAFGRRPFIGDLPG